CSSSGCLVMANSFPHMLPAYLVGVKSCEEPETFFHFWLPRMVQQHCIFGCFRCGYAVAAPAEMHVIHAILKHRFVFGEPAANVAPCSYFVIGGWPVAVVVLENEWDNNSNIRAGREAEASNLLLTGFNIS